MIVQTCSYESLVQDATRRADLTQTALVILAPQVNLEELYKGYGPFVMNHCYRFESDGFHICTGTCRHLDHQCLHSRTRDRENLMPPTADEELKAPAILALVEELDSFKCVHS